MVTQFRRQFLERFAYLFSFKSSLPVMAPVLYFALRHVLLSRNVTVRHHVPTRARHCTAPTVTSSQPTYLL
jgi:hypothetical protein